MEQNVIQHNLINKYLYVFDAQHTMMYTDCTKEVLRAASVIVAFIEQNLTDEQWQLIKNCNSQVTTAESLKEIKSVRFYADYTCSSYLIETTDDVYAFTLVKHEIQLDLNISTFSKKYEQSTFTFHNDEYSYYIDYSALDIFYDRNTKYILINNAGEL